MRQFSGSTFPQHSWMHFSITRGLRPLVMRKCIHLCWGKVDPSNCLMWKSYIFLTRECGLNERRIENSLNVFWSSIQVYLFWVQWDKKSKRKTKDKILMCVFNHDEAKGSQATLLIIIQSLCGLIRRSGLIHFDWDLEILALNSLQQCGV